MKRLITKFKTKDNISLTGALFEPDKRTNKAAIFLHGNGSSDIFDYYNDTSEIAEVFTNNNISYFPFNNRGARYIQKFKYKDAQENKNVVWGGMTFELIKDCIFDIDASIEHLMAQGYTELYLIGGSTGANKIAVYNFYKPNNSIGKYILSGGGDDTGVYFDLLGEDKFNRFLEISKKKVDEGKGLEVIWDLEVPFSYQSLFDTLNPDGDYNVFPYYEAQNKCLGSKELFREVKSITKPTLVMYGENDEYCKPNSAMCVEVLKNALNDKTNFKYQVLPGRDHSLSKNSENLGEVARLEIDFLLS